MTARGAGARIIGARIKLSEDAVGHGPR